MSRIGPDSYLNGLACFRNLILSSAPPSVLGYVYNDLDAPGFSFNALVALHSRFIFCSAPFRPEISPTAICVFCGDYYLGYTELIVARETIRCGDTVAISVPHGELPILPVRSHRPLKRALSDQEKEMPND